jgi:hypothetical protein
MTMDQNEEQSKPVSGGTGAGDSGAPEDVTREGTKEDIRTVDAEKPSSSADTDTLRDGTKS